MSDQSINLNDFSEDPDHFGRIELLLTVKSFDLEAIRKRYLQSRQRNKTGSVERRDPAIGGIVHCVIEDGRLTKSNVLSWVTEARGIDCRPDRLVFSSENRIYLFSGNSSTPQEFHNDWFSYIHTVRWNRTEDRFLVTSSGVDTIMEVSAENGELLWEWLAWEHGLNEGENPETGEAHILTRSPAEAEKYRAQGKNVRLVTDPAADPLPTALRAAFINSAEYTENGDVVVTLFHDGEVALLDPRNGTLRTIIDGLTKPHGGIPFGEGYLVTDTAGGRVVIQRNGRMFSYSFSDLPGKHEAVGDLEWLQTSHYRDSIVLTIDSNRTSFIAFDPEAERRMVVPFDPNWAVQDFVFASGIDGDVLRSVESWNPEEGY